MPLDRRLLYALAFVLSIGPACADEVTDEIDRARKFYGEGKVSQAKQSLEMASQLITQRKAKLLAEVLPPPLAGWSMNEPASTALAPSLLGGGITASRIYMRGPERCGVSVAGDSPAMAMVNMIFSNPSMAAAAGAKVQRIAGQRALLTSDGDIQIISSNNYLVTVSGTCRETDKIAYASGVDYDRLAGF